MIVTEKQYPQGHLMEVGLVQQPTLMEMRVKVNPDVKKCKFDDQIHIKTYYHVVMIKSNAARSATRVTI